MSNLTLNNGYQLEWAEYGAPDGEPVFYFHGVLGTRLEPQSADKVARDLGLRLIAPDRPGYGDSDPQNGFRVFDWPDVISQLADNLQIKCFSILGFSGGGAFALACAHKIPERIKHITLVGSTAPFETDAMQQYINADFKTLYELAAADEAATVQQVAQMATSPEAIMNIVQASLSQTDKNLFKQDQIHAHYLESLTLAIKNGVQGVVNDLRNVALPWGFSLDDIQLPIDIWHGLKDTSIGYPIAEYLDATLNNTSTHYLDNCGHYFLFARWDEVLGHTKLQGLIRHANAI